MKNYLCLPIVLFTVCFIALGCADKPAMAQVSEHGEFASMESALATTIYLPDGEGGVIAEQKRLPWEANMGNYALSFLFPQGQVGYDCRLDGRRMEVALNHFPAFDSIELEQAAVASVVNTLLSLPGVEEVALTFDGETRETLEKGTPVKETFTALVTAAPSPGPGQ